MPTLDTPLNFLALVPLIIVAYYFQRCFAVPKEDRK